MYFADLTSYTYGKHPEHVGLNVGWLDKEHDFSRGAVQTLFVQKLTEISKKPFVKHRGFHVCEFCDFGSWPDTADKSAWDNWSERVNAADASSSTVIRVAGRDGRIYFSPALICHYINKHFYKPPDDFITAVMETN